MKEDFNDEDWDANMNQMFDDEIMDNAGNKEGVKDIEEEEEKVYATGEKAEEEVKSKKSKKKEEKYSKK